MGIKFTLDEELMIAEKQTDKKKIHEPFSRKTPKPKLH